MGLGRLDAVVYDLEIARAIQGRGEERLPDVDYCDGWSDYAGMGVACCCAVDLLTGQAHVYLADNLADFALLAADRRYVMGFNSQAFDDLVMAAAGVEVTTNYDLKVEAQGVVNGKRVPGRRLDDFVRVNLGVSKPIQNHAMLPVMWQRGERGTVIDECLSDVYLTAALIQRLPVLIDPVTMQPITLRAPIDSQQFSLLGEDR